MKKTFAWIGLLLLVIVAGAAAYFYKTYRTASVPSSTAASTTAAVGFILPEGFSMSVYASDVPDARVMAFGPHGEMLVSEPSEGKIIALVDADNDGKAEKRVTVASGLNVPHGMEFKDGKLYVAEKDALDVFVYNAATMQASGKKKLLDLPGGSLGEHFTRTLLFMPSPDDATLLVSVGSSCNVCGEEDPQRATIIAYDTKTGSSSEFARGLRNSVFMAIHPVTGAIWATEMGRDGLGDDIPPDEVNIIEEGGNYGWPNCFGQNIHDGAYDKNVYIRNPCMAPFETPSYIDIPAHSAPLGLAFVPEEGWPQSWAYDMVVAYHGSWNRSVPTGYKVVRYPLDAEGRPEGAPVDLITGWLQPDGKKLGRPVDVKVMPGGTMYISDDGAGIIYKAVKR